MKVCLYSKAFFPSIGGLEQVSYTLANYWFDNCSSLCVVTDTPTSEDDSSMYRFKVIRCPNKQQWKSILKENDLVVSNGYSLKHIAIWLLSRKPIIWVHQTYIPNIFQTGTISFKERIKPFISRIFLPLASKHVFISKAIQKQVGASNGVLIYNPVDTKFRPLSNASVEGDFGFFGRMVPEKGVDTLLQSLSICRLMGKDYTLSLYGEGPELENLKSLAHVKNVGDLVKWHPFVRDLSLVEAMNKYKAIIIPSRWAEPMGIVAIEAMACKKVVIGSSQGGLGEVIGRSGLTFENGDANELSQCMLRLMENPTLLAELEEKSYKRGEGFSLRSVGNKYIALFSNVLEQNRGNWII